MRELPDLSTKEGVSVLHSRFSILERFLPRIAILLCGSSTTRFADGYSGQDFLVLCPDEDWVSIKQLIPGTQVENGHAEARIGGDRPGKMSLWSEDALRQLVESWDDLVLFTLQHAEIWHDPLGLASHAVAKSRQVPDEVWRKKTEERYRLFRQRKASMAWALRRGQPLVFLDSFNQALTHALTLCYYLEGQPPANRKWLFSGALRMGAGQKIRPVVYELLASLGDSVTLGGSYSLKSNRLYTLLGRLQACLEELIHKKWAVQTQEGGHQI